MAVSADMIAPSRPKFHHPTPLIPCPNARQHQDSGPVKGLQAMHDGGIRSSAHK